MGDLKSILSSLIQFQSISPHDAGCQNYLIEFLEALGFTCQRFDNPPVANLFARWGNQAPLLIFAGHTDVVPIGDRSKWNTDPFQLIEKNGFFYGRGTADMKGSIACMLLAASRFVKSHPSFTGSLGFLITSGEEGDDFNLGTPYVMQELHNRGVHPNYCIVGEPSSTERVGDVLKIGRRGSLSARLTVHGKQGHVAYPHLAENPIHVIAPALLELTTARWDEGNDYFPPTSMQITHIASGGHAGNVIPGDLALQFNFRYSTEQTAETLQQQVTSCFERHKIKVNSDWQLNGKPFLTTKGPLLKACTDAIFSVTQQKPELSTSGGTSDGRFIAPYGVEVIELGPVNATIHQVNECVASADLTTLTELYYVICKQLLAAI